MPPGIALERAREPEAEDDGAAEAVEALVLNRGEGRDGGTEVLQDLPRRVLAGVVHDHDLEIALQLGHDLTQLPQHDADGTLFIERGNAKVFASA